MAQPQQVISEIYPFLRVRVVIRQWDREGLALLDTGFEGSLAIPAFVLDQDVGPPDTSTRWRLADGSPVEAPVYHGSLEIIGLPLISDVTMTALGDEFILGRRVLDRFKVTFDHGQRILVEP